MNLQAGVEVELSLESDKIPVGLQVLRFKV